MMFQLLDPQMDEAVFRQAWEWMQGRAEYAGIEGVKDFECFSAPARAHANFALTVAGELVGFVQLVRDAKGRCEVVLITPPQPRVFAVLRALRQLEEWFRRTFPGCVFYVRSWERGAVLARRYGLKHAQEFVFYA